MRNQPGAGCFPIAFHRDLGDAERDCHFVFLQTGEETQFHHTRRAGVDGSELREGFVKREDVLVSGDRCPPIHARQTDALSPSATLIRNGRPGVIDKYAAHDLGGDSKEVGAVLIGDYLAAEQAHTELIDQGTRLQCVIYPFSLKKVRSNLAQPDMDGFEQSLASRSIPAAPERKPRSDLLGVRHAPLSEMIFRAASFRYYNWRRSVLARAESAASEGL